MSDQLLQTPTQGIPKSVDEIVSFIESLQDKDIIKIYSAERRLLGSGIKLVPVKNISDKRPYIVVVADVATYKYHLFCETKGETHADTDCYSNHRRAVVEQLSADLHAQNIIVAYNGKLMIPADQIVMRVKLSSTELWKCAMIDYKVSSVGEMNVEYVPSGLKHTDNFLEKVCRFARGEKIN